jgi:hypothetical protein
MKIKMYYKSLDGGERKVLKKIEIEVRSNFVIKLPPRFYLKRMVYNPFAGMLLPLSQYPTEILEH